MSLLAGAMLVLALVATGWWPMRALAASLAGPTLTGRVAVACALGAAITGLVQVLLSACGVPAQAAVPAALAVASLLLGWRRGPRTVSPDAPARLPGWLALLLAGVAVVGLGIGVGTPFRSDGGKFWAPKARELAAFGASEAPSLHDAQRLGLHRDYPLLVPALLAPAFAHSPPDAAAGPKLLLGALTLALLGVMAALLLRCGVRGLALLAVFATQPLLVSADVRESALAGGFVDGVDALFLLLLVVAVERVRESPPGSGRRDVVLACLAGGALASTKLEGSVEAACVLAAALVAGPRRRALPAVAAGAALLMLPTLLVRLAVAADDAGFEVARLADPQVLASRLPTVLAGFGGLLLDASSFGLLPLLLLWWTFQRPAVIAVGSEAGASTDASPARARRTFAIVLLALAAAFLVASYVSTSMHAGRHVDTSAHRLLWHWLPAMTWLVARPGGRA